MHPHRTEHPTTAQFEAMAELSAGRDALARIVAELQAAEREIVAAGDDLPRVLAIARRAEQIDTTDAFSQIICGAEDLSGDRVPAHLHAA